MKRHRDLKSELLKDPEVRREYERLEPEFQLIQTLLEARSRANLSQSEIAERMGTTQSVIARLEGGHVTPNWKTLQRYAEATGSRLHVTLEANDA